jgi:hypothetical protein
MIPLARPIGFEPMTYGSGASPARLGEGSKRSQVAGTAHVGTHGRVQPPQGLVPSSSRFAARVLQASAGRQTGPRSSRGRSR